VGERERGRKRWFRGEGRWVVGGTVGQTMDYIFGFNLIYFFFTSLHTANVKLFVLAKTTPKGVVKYGTETTETHFSRNLPQIFMLTLKNINFSSKR
jgi:hypothetical protein